MAKPDNRADNAAHLQAHIENTEQNLQEAHQYLDEHSDEISPTAKQSIEAKNKRREVSIQQFASEQQDEI